MPIEELIKKLQAEGKSADQIAAAVMSADPSQKSEDVCAKVSSELKALEAAEMMRKQQSESSAKEQARADVAALVKEELKNMKPEVKEVKEVKSFSLVSGKWDTTKNMSEDMKAFNNLIIAVDNGDAASIKSVTAEIEASKASDYKAMGFSPEAIKTALYSDATTGSYMIPTEVEGMIFERAWQSKMLSRVNTRAIAYNSKLYPVMAQMDFAFIADESTEIGDKTPTIDNPSIAMKRFGGMAYLANALLIMKGPELTRALANGFGDALARFADLYIPCASISGNSDLFNGLIFDTRSRAGTTKALSSANIQDLQELKNLLGPKWRADAVFYGNTNVRDTYGLLNSDNIPLFRNFVETGEFRPFGLEFLEVPYIPSTFDAATMRTTGTNDVLGCFNPQGVFVGFEPMRLDVSTQFKFSYDQVAFRAVSRMGSAVISQASTQGAVSSFKYLSN